MTKGFFTLLRRELWEHNTLKWLPLGLLLFIFLANLAVIFAIDGNVLTVTSDGIRYSLGDVIGQYKDPQGPDARAVSNALQSGMVIKGVLFVLGMIINSVLQIMMAFYLLDCLHRERKDYSILFWKSLPISDTTIVLSKLAVAALVIPVISMVTIAVADLMTLSLLSILLRDTPGAISLMWQQADVLQFWQGHMFLFIEQSLWYFPVMGWLLLCSAWSKKSPFVPAIVLPMLLVFVDSSFRLDSGISAMLLERSPVGLPSAMGVDGFHEWEVRSGEGVRDSEFSWLSTLMQLNFSGLLDFLGQMKVWLGLIVGAFFTGVAIWIRRWQGDSL